PRRAPATGHRPARLRLIVLNRPPIGGDPPAGAGEQIRAPRPYPNFLAAPLPFPLLAAPAAAHADDAAPLDQVVVTAAQPSTAFPTAPNTAAGVSAETIARTVNVVTPEDTLRYLPNILIRQRHIGDTQAPVTTRPSGVGASARSL